MQTFRKQVLIAAWLGSSAVGCRSGETSGTAVAPIGPVSPVAHPAPEGALTPFLAHGDDDRVLLSWSRRLGGDSAAIELAVMRAGAWGPVRQVTASDRLFINWADYASVLPLGGDSVAAHWLATEGAGKYSYGVRIATSPDAGARWGTPTTPHTDGLEAEHGFVTLWREADGVGAAWLDGRKSAMKDSVPEMTVRTAVLVRDGLAREAQLDARTCDCCQTAAAHARSGMVVIYRDRTADELRDISVVRQTASGWSAPTPVSVDRWMTRACPVNGPSLAARGDTVAAAWFTAASDTAKALVALSPDAGAHFGPPVRIDDGSPIGRVQLLIEPSGDAIVSWLERLSTDSAEVRVRRVTSDGRMSAATTITRVAASRGSGFARMIRDGDRLLFAWTVAGAPSRIAMAQALARPVTVD
ncbi:MAG: hypothetical protein SFW08_08310 [Gemmatimonadaceae bacterium]|nr:hypothetical protein [Gemmatimonadaceae bacterium]